MSEHPDFRTSGLSTASVTTAPGRTTKVCGKKLVSEWLPVCLPNPVIILTRSHRVWREGEVHCGSMLITGMTLMRRPGIVRLVEGSGRSSGTRTSLHHRRQSRYAAPHFELVEPA